MNTNTTAPAGVVSSTELGRLLGDWYEQGMAYAYTEATDPDAGDEWTTEDIAKAFAAGAALAERDALCQQPSEVEKFMDAAGLCRRCAAPLDELPNARGKRHE